MKETNMKGRHVGLDFYDLLIEALKTPILGEEMAQTRAIAYLGW
jgi:hypothetical protein